MDTAPAILPAGQTPTSLPSWLARLPSGATLAARVILSAGLLATAVWLASDKLDWRQLQSLTPTVLLTCAMLSTFVIWSLAWRWRQVVLGLSERGASLPGIGSFMRQTWLCLAVNQVVPSIIGGDALRASLLAGQGVPLTRAAGSVLVDRAYGLVGLATITLASAFLLGPDLLLPAIGTAIAVLAGIALVAFGSRFILKGKLSGILLARQISVRTTAVMVAAAIAGHLANIAIFLVIGHALGADLPIFPAIAVMCAVLLVGMLPVSIAGWGVRELALLQTFGHMGLAPEKIVLSSVTYGLVLFIAQASGFLLFARRNRP